MDSRQPFNNTDNASVSRLSVAKDMQREAARIHSEFQKTFSETHLAFLKSTEHCFGLLLQGEGLRETVRESVPAQSTVIEQNIPVKLLASHQVLADAPLVHEKETVEPFKFSALSASEKTSAPIAIKENSLDIQKILIDVIAEKTGYPQDLIKIEMTLDTDLGIDSIKRVEIFSQLAEKIPHAADIDPQTMNKLSSLQNILDFLGSDLEKDLPAKKKSIQTHRPNSATLND